jgi:hypothetical protein
MPDRPTWLRRLLEDEDVPEVLYHYTSHAGLTGILEKRALWATNIRCLNDEREYELAVTLTGRAIERLIGGNEVRERRTRSTGKRTALIRGIEDYRAFLRVLPELREAGPGQVYVASLSRHGNQLSQWRGYCPNGNGYSVGLSSDALREAPVSPDYFLARCIYDEATQDFVVQHFLRQIAAEYRAQGITTAIENRGDFRRQRLTELFPLLAPVIKDQSFNEEGEWRLITASVSSRSETLKFRPGRSYIVPYVEAQMAERSNSSGVPTTTWALERIVIGPSPNVAVAAESVRILLERYRATVKAIDPSGIPFRAW